MEKFTKVHEPDFQTRCKVHKEECTLIIDGDYDADFASEYLVEHLCLVTTPHPNPYELPWPKKTGTIQVTKQVRVFFRIGRYEDVALCDVIPMMTSHIMLGHNWEKRRRATYKTKTGDYALIHNGGSFYLETLSPWDCIDDQHTTRRKSLWFHQEKEAKKKEEQNKAIRDSLRTIQELLESVETPPSTMPLSQENNSVQVLETKLALVVEQVQEEEAFLVEDEEVEQEEEGLWSEEDFGWLEDHYEEEPQEGESQEIGSEEDLLYGWFPLEEEEGGRFEGEAYENESQHAYEEDVPTDVSGEELELQEGEAPSEEEEEGYIIEWEEEEEDQAYDDQEVHYDYGYHGEDEEEDYGGGNGGNYVFDPGITWMVLGRAYKDSGRILFKRERVMSPPRLIASAQPSYKGAPLSLSVLGLFTTQIWSQEEVREARGPIGGLEPEGHPWHHTSAQGCANRA